MKPPKLAGDLYGDLRDRRLLPLVVVLVLATLALPFLLKSDAASAPALDPSAGADLPDEVGGAAVLVADPELRDYRERLDRLRSKDPFAGQPLAQQDLSSAAIEDVSGGGGGGGGSTAAPLPEVEVSGSVSESVTESTSTTSETVTEPASSGSGGGSGGGSGSGGGGARSWYSFSVDVAAGPAGEARRREDVKELTVLPSKSNPVAIYLGVDEAGRRALFTLSSDVAGVEGDGSCIPRPSSCEFLTLKKGEEARLEYAPSGEPATFVLRVEGIEFERVKDAPDPRDARSLEPGKARAGLEAFLGL